MERMTEYRQWKTPAESSAAAFGRHLPKLNFLHQCVSTCVSSHMPRQWDKLCLVTWSILHCPINNRHNLRCQKPLSEADLYVWIKVQEYQANEVEVKWALDTMPFAGVASGVCMHEHAHSTCTQPFFQVAPWADLDWTFVLSTELLQNYGLLHYLRFDHDHEPLWCFLRKSNEANADKAIMLCYLPCFPSCSSFFPSSSHPLLL